MSKKTESKWLTQMHVLDPAEDSEESKPYAVEYTADGDRRTRVLSADEVAEIRAFNGLPAEEVVSEEEGGE